MTWSRLVPLLLLALALWPAGGLAKLAASRPDAQRLDTADDGQCPYCHVREAQREMQIQAIKAQILQKLGMAQAPNMTGRKLPVLADAIIQRYMKQEQRLDEESPHDQQYYDEDDDHSQTEKMWTFASRSPLAKGSGPLSQDELRDKLLYFQLDTSITEMDLEQASLWLYIRRRDVDINVEIKRLVDVGNDSYIMKQALKKRIPRHQKRSSDYVQIDVKDLVLDWFHFPEENYGIEIHTKTVYGYDDNLSVKNFLDAEGDSVHLPVLEVNVSSDRRRTKRTAGGNFCTDNSTDTNCCRYPLVVDFHVFGWDWIIAPSSYKANYCSGNCPYVYLQKYPHTHIVQQVGGTSGPCCGPRKLSPIHMLYWDTFNHIRFDKLPNMIVDSCGCH